MICKQTWERYLLKEILKVFLLFLLSFYFLYTVIDYSMHVQEIIKSQKISLRDLGLYYSMLFSKRCDLLLPLALLIASLKVLLSLNRKNELLAFQAGGIQLKRLLRPFFLVAVVCMLINYLNFEWVIPRSLTFIERFEKHNFRSKKAQKKKGEGVHMLPLEDGSRLIYQEYDPEAKELFDVYWLLSADKFFHMKKLSIASDTPTGIFVDALYRSEKGLLEKIDSYDNYPFHRLKLDFDLKNYIGKPMESRSITELVKLQRSPKLFWKEKKDAIRVNLYSKLLLPWLSLFVIIGIAPFAVRFSRNLSAFLLFSLAIFGYIAFFMIIEATTILGESHIVDPFAATFTVPFLFLLYFGRKFLKLG